MTSAPTSLHAVCVHGAGAGGWQWNVWVRVLAAHGIAASAHDLCARSSGLAQTSFDDYRRQVECWVGDAASSGAGVVLIGASLGGLLALSVAAHDSVAAVVLINPMPPLGVTSKPLGKPFPPLVAWGSQRSWADTRRAMPDADDAAALYAFRRWRDESGLALEQARAGIAVEVPACPVLVLASADGDDVPPMVSRALAIRFGADHERLDGCSHVGPLLGTSAAEIAQRTTQWLLRKAASVR
ncbi:MAG: alpha/beta fold hydrolase [Dokdonella sp.]